MGFYTRSHSQNSPLIQRVKQYSNQNAAHQTGTASASISNDTLGWRNSTSKRCAKPVAGSGSILLACGGSPEPILHFPSFVCSRCNGVLYSYIFLTESKVTDVSVTTSVEDGNVTLTVSWTAPQSELPITEYEVEYRIINTKSWIDSTRLSVSPSTNSTILTGLDAGVEYIVRVRALSEIGAGAWSDEQTTVTPADSECIWSIC